MLDILLAFEMGIANSDRLPVVMLSSKFNNFHAAPTARSKLLPANAEAHWGDSQNAKGGSGWLVCHGVFSI